MVNARGKWALITGASRGVGYQISLFMARQGCNLILHSRDLTHTKSLEAEVRALGVDAFSVAADLADPVQIGALLGMMRLRGTFWASS